MQIKTYWWELVLSLCIKTHSLQHFLIKQLTFIEIHLFEYNQEYQRLFLFSASEMTPLNVNAISQSEDAADLGTKGELCTQMKCDQTFFVFGWFIYLFSTACVSLVELAGNGSLSSARLIITSLHVNHENHQDLNHICINSCEAHAAVAAAQALCQNDKWGLLYSRKTVQ